jgi:hypothetical protein
MDVLLHLLDQEYDPAVRPLLVGMIEFMTTVRPTMDAFPRQFYRFIKTYVPNPNGNPDALKKNSTLVNDRPMIYNRIFQSTFEDQPIITKTSNEFTSDIIHEIFLNVVILNTFLFQGVLSQCIVPTLGCFVSPQVSDKKICVKTPTEQFTGRLYMNMVQYYIPGEQLASVLKRDGVSLSELKCYIGRVISTLVILHESPYRIRHNDLHTGNIMITPNKEVYIIDYGLSTFTYKGVVYKPSLDNTRESDYYQSETYQHICALDLFSLFHNIANDVVAKKSKHQKEIYAYAEDILYRLFYNRLYSSTREFITPSRTIDLGKEFELDPGPIRNESWFYILLRAIERDSSDKLRVHQLNRTVLTPMTYRWCMEQICHSNESEYQEYDMDWDSISKTIEKSPDLDLKKPVRERERLNIEKKPPRERAPDLDVKKNTRKKSPKELKQSPKESKKCPKELKKSPKKLESVQKN